MGAKPRRPQERPRAPQEGYKERLYGLKILTAPAALIDVVQNGRKMASNGGWGMRDGRDNAPIGLDKKAKRAMVASSALLAGSRG